MSTTKGRTPKHSNPVRCTGCGKTLTGKSLAEALAEKEHREASHGYRSAVVCGECIKAQDALRKEQDEMGRKAMLDRDSK